MKTSPLSRSVWVVLAGISLVAGCAPSPDSVEPHNTTTAEVSPEVAPQELETPGVVACEPQDDAAIREVIRGQSEALGAGDFETAYTFASLAFRAGVDLAGFERVITTQYDMLVYFEDASFGPCELLDEGTARVNVEVLSAFYRPVALIYDVVLVDGRWWVSAVQNPVSAIPNA